MNAATLLEQLQHGDRHLRDEAFDRIARSRDPELLEPLAALAQPSSTYLETLFCQYLQNVPSNLALGHLQRLLHSPHAATRQHALDALDQIDIEQRLQPLIDLLSCPHRDVQLHVLKELGVHRRSVALNAIRPLLDSAERERVEAAFEAVQRIDAPRSISMLRPFLKASDPWRQVAALEALGRMATFKRWKPLLPCLRSDAVEVRQAAILNLNRKGQARANRQLIRLLGRETDEEVAKLAINRLALFPNERMARLLIRIAATHDNLQLRRSASWVIEELDENLLRKAMLALLTGGDEELQAYILTKMGTRQLPDCGPILVEHLQEKHAARVRYAALEGLGFLRQREFLSAVVPYLRSADPMAAYVATLTAVQLIVRIDDCPELTELLLAPEDEHVPLKQVVLQYMIDAISWDFDDPTLFQVLVENLHSGNENISYLSAILLGKCRGQRQLVPPLLESILENPSADIRQVARDSLDQVLDGDLSPLLDLMEGGSRDPDQLCLYAGLLSTLRWNAESASRALEIFPELPCPEGMAQADQFRRDIARGLYKANHQACRIFFAQAPADDHWRLAVGQAWLESLGALNLPEDRADWQKLFVEGNTDLVRTAVRAAVDVEAEWTLESLIARIEQCPDDPLTPELRQAVRKLTEL